MARILVVDDEPMNIRLAVAALEQCGHQVTVAAGGEAGIAAARGGDFDLVLMDIQMAGTDGRAALKRLRGDPRTRRLKIAAFTALAMKGDAERLLAEGFDGYVEKPIRYQAFLYCIAALLEGEKV